MEVGHASTASPTASNGGMRGMQGAARPVSRGARRLDLVGCEFSFLWHLAPPKHLSASHTAPILHRLCQMSRLIRPRSLISHLKIGSPGRITRRFAPRPFGVALKGDRRRCAASSNRTCFLSAVRISADESGNEVGLIGPLKIGSPGRIRTADQVINSHLLYH